MVPGSSFESGDEATLLLQNPVGILASPRSINFYSNSQPHLEAFPQWLTEVLSDLVDTDTAHGPNSQCPNERVRVLAILGEGVDSKNGQVRLGFGVVHEVEVHKFLQLQVVSLHAVYNISKE